MQSLQAGLALAILAAAPALAQDDLVKTATASMTSADGASLGTLALSTTPAGVIIRGELRGLPPGFHGFHVHAAGACEPPFESAGGHYNPGEAEHGFLTEAGPHAGDMTNIFVAQDGAVTIELLNSFLTLDTGLLDDDGAAVLVHAMPDDYATQPSGHAGDRIACGAIEPD
jgi:Cu-Zn family superoxide dismutase